MVRRRFAAVVRYWWREAIWCTSASRRCSGQFLRSWGPGAMAHCSVQVRVSCWADVVPLQPVLVILGASSWGDGALLRSVIGIVVWVPLMVLGWAEMVLGWVRWCSEVAWVCWCYSLGKHDVPFILYLGCVYTYALLNHWNVVIYLVRLLSEEVLNLIYSQFWKIAVNCMKINLMNGQPL